MSDQPVTTYSTPSIESAPDVEKKPIPAEMKELLGQENLAEYLSEQELSSHLAKVQSGVASDRQSMAHYLKKYKRAVKRAKMLPEHDEKNFPIDNASNVVMPYLFDAATDFNARISPALLERDNICYIKVNGKDEVVIPQEVIEQVEQVKQIKATQGDEAAAQLQAQIAEQLSSMTPPKQARAERVADSINYDLNEGMPEWRDQTDTATMLLPIAGMFFRKIWQCPMEERRKSELIYPDDMIYDHDADSFDAAPRKSFEFSMDRNSVITAIRSGQFIDWDNIHEDTETDTYHFTETHCNMDLDGDGYAEPYIATIAKDLSRFVSIVPRFSEEDVVMNKDSEVTRIKGEEFFVQTIFIRDPVRPAVGLGYGIIADDMYRVIDTNTNQMVDAGTLNNVAANSGFIRQGTRTSPRAGNRQKKGTVEMVLGKFTTWESDGTNPLTNDIAQLPFAGPSQPLMTLLEQLKLELREMTTASQNLDANPGEAASLYLARLSQSLIRPNSITVRVFMGLTKEFQRIYDVQRRYMTQDQYMNVLDDPEANKKADFEEESQDIKPTADPSQGSEIQRVARAETMLEKAIAMPQIFGLRYAAQEYSKAIGADTEKFVPTPQAGQPDPIQIMIAQSQQQMSEAEKMKATADIMEAQVKMADVDLKYMELGTKIEKMESEIIKNLSEADKNQADIQNSEQKRTLDLLKERRESFKQQRENLKEIINAAEIGAGRLAQTPDNTNVPRSFEA